MASAVRRLGVGEQHFGPAARAEVERRRIRERAAVSREAAVKKPQAAVHYHGAAVPPRLRNELRLRRRRTRLLLARCTRSAGI